MGSRKTIVWRWVVQICIILALLSFVLFVFYGPTGLGGSAPVPSGERRPFALFKPVSNQDLENARIAYTNNQIQKLRDATQKANFNSSVYVPEKGASGDYLEEIRVFPQKRMIQLVYPHFGIIESEMPIQTEPKAVHTTKKKLSIGSAIMSQYQHGGYHLSIHLNHSYILMDSDEINHQSKFFSIADSIVMLRNLK